MMLRRVWTTVIALMALATAAHADDKYIGIIAALGFSPGSPMSVSNSGSASSIQTAPYDVSGPKDVSSLNLAFGLEEGWVVTPEWDFSMQQYVRILQATSEVSSSTSALYSNGGASANNQIGAAYNSFDLGFIAQYNPFHGEGPGSRWSIGAGLGGGVMLSFANSEGYGTPSWPSSTDSKEPKPTFSYPDVDKPVRVFAEARLAGDISAHPMGFGFKGGVNVRYVLGSTFQPATIRILGGNSSSAVLTVSDQPLWIVPFVDLYWNF